MKKCFKVPAKTSTSERNYELGTSWKRESRTEKAGSLSQVKKRILGAGTGDSVGGICEGGSWRRRQWNGLGGVTTKGKESFSSYVHLDVNGLLNKSKFHLMSVRPHYSFLHTFKNIFPLEREAAGGADVTWPHLHLPHTCCTAARPATGRGFRFPPQIS